MATPQELHDALYGKVRGHPVGIKLFHEEVPESFTAVKVDPCRIVRHAMDMGERCYIDGANQDCITGAFTAGLHEGTEEIRDGAYLAKNIPSMSKLAAHKSKVGHNVLPQGMLRAIGAVPLNDVPEGLEIDWICVVCTPAWANWIASARSVLDGTPPRGAAGTSFCSELFAVPWHEDNVVMTTGDIGGRMNNRLKPEEMFVIVPWKYTDSLLNIMTTYKDVDARGALEATRPADSPYWEKRKRSAERHKAVSSETGDAPAVSFTMDWDDDAQAMIRTTPAGIIDMAITTVEEFAEEKGYDTITRNVLEEQMASIGMDPSAFGG